MLEFLRVQDKLENKWETLKSVFLGYDIFPKSQSILRTNEGSEQFLVLGRVKHQKNRVTCPTGIHLVFTSIPVKR